jgi:hypothetical protein
LAPLPLITTPFWLLPLMTLRSLLLVPPILLLAAW